MLSKYHTTILRPLFWDHPGEPVPEENFWTLWCKGRLTEADTPTIRLGATPSGLTSDHLHHPPYFLQTGCPSCHPTNSVKANNRGKSMSNWLITWKMTFKTAWKGLTVLVYFYFPLSLHHYCCIIRASLRQETGCFGNDVRRQFMFWCFELRSIVFS